MRALVVWLKRRTGCRTWHVEAAFVFLVLAAAAIASGKGGVEWVGVFAVLTSFMHGQVADRLSEAAGRDAADGGHAVECWRRERRYFVLKELLWVTYFFALGAWSALVGALVFAAYRPWRTHWRRP
ncbi:MAG: hypothetical protein H6697_09840 [Myxococcales bacterium]|nr:hypothetical protein [Myxococcales bacterium]